MPFKHSDGIRYLTFDSLLEVGLPHAVFTRQGGVSPEPWASLNLSITVGDTHERVRENKVRALISQGQSPKKLYEVWQVHSNEVRFATQPRDPAQAYEKADGIFTNRPGLGLLMRFADCVPILLHDPIQKVVGLVHAGWQGTVNHIAGFAVKAMQERYGTKSGDVVAVIGPSIGPHHYEVGMDVIQKVAQAFEDDSHALLSDFDHNRSDEKMLFDLWQANRLVLEQSGVKNIEVAEICTACHPDDWYSHRGEGGRTGRFGVYIALPE